MYILVYLLSILY